MVSREESRIVDNVGSMPESNNDKMSIDPDFVLPTPDSYLRLIATFSTRNVSIARTCAVNPAVKS